VLWQVFGCFKRPDKHFAQCRNRAAHAGEDDKCVDSDEWLCPTSWMEREPKKGPPPQPEPPPVTYCPTPVAPHGGCFHSRCCSESQKFGCFKRPDRNYAQCRPLASQTSPGGECEDTDGVPQAGHTRTCPHSRNPDLNRLYLSHKKACKSSVHPKDLN
jgi:hypothetical protein